MSDETRKTMFVRTNGGVGRLAQRNGIDLVVIPDETGAPADEAEDWIADCVRGIEADLNGRKGLHIVHLDEGTQEEIRVKWYGIIQARWSREQTLRNDE